MFLNENKHTANFTLHDVHIRLEQITGRWEAKVYYEGDT